MKIAFALFSDGLMPWFSSSVLLSSLTQAPGVMGVTPPPSAVSQNDRVPEEVCGRNALILPLFPPTLLQLVILHSKIPASWLGVRLAGALVPPLAADLAAQVTASPASATKQMPPVAHAGSVVPRPRDDRA